MSQESSNQSNSQSQSASASKPCRPKVDPNKTINYRQDGGDKCQKKS
jgi:hypothetical protein